MYVKNVSQIHKNIRIITKQQWNLQYITFKLQLECFHEHKERFRSVSQGSVQA